MTNDELAAIKARAEAVEPFVEKGDPVVALNGRITVSNGPYSIYQAHKLAAFYSHAHRDVPALIAEVERLQDALRGQIEYNHLRNDKDAYLLAMAQWGLTGKWGAEEENTERPQASEFGL